MAWPQLTACAAALAAALYCYLGRAPGLGSAPQQYATGFQQIAPGVARQGYLWRTPGGSFVDVHVFLVTRGKDSMLVDVGAPTVDFERMLMTALKQTLGTVGRLRAILRELDSLPAEAV